MERQKINDEAEAEKSRRDLLELQAQSAAVESTGQAKAEAQSRAEAARIAGEAEVSQAKLKAEASRIQAVSNQGLTRFKCCISQLGPRLPGAGRVVIDGVSCPGFKSRALY